MGDCNSKPNENENQEEETYKETTNQWSAFENEKNRILNKDLELQNHVGNVRAFGNNGRRDISLHYTDDAGSVVGTSQIDIFGICGQIVVVGRTDLGVAVVDHYRDAIFAGLAAPDDPAETVSQRIARLCDTYRTAVLDEPLHKGACQSEERDRKEQSCRLGPGSRRGRRTAYRTAHPGNRASKTMSRS